MANLRNIDRTLSVTAQLTAADLPQLANLGVRTIINNRPDGEEPGQMPAREASRIASELGLAYHHLPVTLASLTVADAAAFASLVASSDGPVVAHCRSGARSTNLWVLSRLASGELTTEQARRWAEEQRVDIGGALAAFAREQGR